MYLGGEVDACRMLLLVMWGLFQDPVALSTCVKRNSSKQCLCPPAMPFLQSNPELKRRNAVWLLLFSSISAHSSRRRGSHSISLSKGRELGSSRLFSQHRMMNRRPAPLLKLASTFEGLLDLVVKHRDLLQAVNNAQPC